MLSEEDFYLWRTFRLLANNYGTVLKFSRSNIIDYSLKNVILIILKAFSEQPHSKIEAIKEKLQEVRNAREEAVEAPESPIIESDQESGEVQLNGREEKSKAPVKQTSDDKRPGRDKPKRYTREPERGDRESQTKPRVFRSDRADRGDHKSQGKGFKPGYKRHKYY